MKIPHLIILVLWGTLEWFVFRTFTIFIKVNPKIIQRYEKMTKLSSKLLDFKMKHSDQHLSFFLIAFYYLTHFPLPSQLVSTFIISLEWMIYACLFLLLCSTEQKDITWFAKNKSNFFCGSYTRQIEVVIIEEKSFNHKGLGGYSWIKSNISHAPQVSTWEVLLNSLAPKPGQHCPSWWLSISMATHHWGTDSGRVNTFMCQLTLEDDRPRLSFLRLYRIGGMGLLHGYYLSREAVILSATVAESTAQKTEENIK